MMCLSSVGELKPLSQASLTVYIVLGRCNSIVLLLHLSNFGELLEDTSHFYTGHQYLPSEEIRAHRLEGQGQKVG